MSNELQRAAREWLAAKDVIRDTLATMLRGADTGHKQDPSVWADAIIARLANHKPPILLEMQSEEAPQAWTSICMFCGHISESDRRRTTCEDCGSTRINQRGQSNGA